jgi:hypothetical protein
MKLALEKELTPAISKFATELLNAGESVAAMLDRLGIKKQSTATLTAEMKDRGLVDSSTTNDSGMSFGVSMANGGIASGPKSGFNATLHGTEAVVPLSDNRSIPVSFDGGGLGELASKLDDLIRVMSDNRDYTERLMHNMS